MEAVNIILILFILVCAVASVRVKELVSAVFILGCYSFFVAVLWSLLLAVDVSFTEALAGAGIATIFFLLALFGSVHFVKAKPPSTISYWGLALACLVGALLIWGSKDLAWFGDLNAAPHTHVSPFYLLNTIHDSHTPNAVTAIVVDYRGFDTLIETAVIFTAGVACLLVIKDKGKQP